MRQATDDLITSSDQAHTLTRRAALGGIAAASVAVPAVAVPAIAGTTLPDRKAMEAYAAWLHMERRILCMELWPDYGPGADRYVFGDNAGYDWHFRGPKPWNELPQPSSRAASVLDLVGVDWRGHKGEADAVYVDSGRRPDAPEWPGVDAELLAASASLCVLRLAINGLHDMLGDEAENHPQYPELEAKRAADLEVLGTVSSQSRRGIESKASGISTLAMDDPNDPAIIDIAVSLAEDMRLRPMVA